MHEWRRRGLHAELGKALSLFGFTTKAQEAPAEVVALAERRQQARADKDFAESDRLRHEIAAAGWDVRDEAGGFRLVQRS
jgi:cysteinyl-tRNA synthetase